MHPQVSRGLGFTRMRDMNLALVSKLGWKLHSRSDSMWVSQLSGKYLLYGSFLSLPPPHSSSSWLWKGILLSREIIRLGACHRIHPLSSSSVWNSSWIPTLKLFIPSPAQNSLIPPNLIISDLITPNAAWNLPLITSLFDPSSVREIQKIKIHPNPSVDLWTPSPNGNFSTKSGFKLISSHRPSPPPPLLNLMLGNCCGS
jgi:hypothetical protein